MHALRFILILTTRHRTPKRVIKGHSGRGITSYFRSSTKGNDATSRQEQNAQFTSASRPPTVARPQREMEHSISASMNLTRMDVAIQQLAIPTLDSSECKVFVRSEHGGMLRVPMYVSRPLSRCNLTIIVKP
jgi:hypothetical protein